MDEELLFTTLSLIVKKIDQLERNQQNGRPNTPQPEGLAGALSALSGGGQPASNRLVKGPDQWPAEPIPQPTRPPLFTGFEQDDPPGEPRVPHRMAPGFGSVSSPLPRSGVRPLPNAQPGIVPEVTGGRYEPAPPPQQAATEGSQFIQCFGDQWVQVRSEDGVLLGAMPMFGSDVQTIFTEQRQQLSVGMLAVRAVVVPYNQGVDPHHIQGFVPAPGVQRGPLQTGPVGRGANLENTDIGRQL